MRNYSKAEAGRLGAKASKIVVAANKEKRILEYSQNPKKCKQCLETLDYSNRNKLFCNHSCSATFNNLRREKESRSPVSWNCLNCNNEHITVEWRTGKYCNLNCQKQYEFTQRITNWLEKNEPIGKGVIKKYLSNTYGYKCVKCGISDWNNEKIVLELEHKDGNSSNNSIDNVCLLCPNCHSQTSTFKGKNKGNGRHARRIRYSEGKSF